MVWHTRRFEGVIPFERKRQEKLLCFSIALPFFFIVFVSFSLFSPKKRIAAAAATYNIIEEIWESFDEFQFAFHRAQLSIFHLKYTLNVNVSVNQIRLFFTGSTRGLFSVIFWNSNISLSDNRGFLIWESGSSNCRLWVNEYASTVVAVSIFLSIHICCSASRIYCLN